MENAEALGMRNVVHIIASRLLALRAGRWALTAILFLIGAAGFIAYPSITQNESATDGLTALVTGIVFTGLGILLLALTIRLERLQRRVKRGERAGKERVNELKASGQLLSIPGLPPLPTGLTPEDVTPVEAYADRMAKLPWGDHPQVSVADAPGVFNRTVAQVRSIRGDWSQLAEPIDLFVGLPRPWCYVGAAEIMHRLSYIRGTIFASVGLRQGLRFIARAQYTEPMQPDALVIRTKLLAASSSKNWLELADQTLARLREVAPEHPRLPDAEAALHLRRGEYEAALVCFDRLIANPPSMEEAFAAQANQASALESLNRYDEALDAYARALRLNPNDAWVWHNSSILLMKQGKLDEALQANTRALSIMDFSNARMIHERILAEVAKRAEVANDMKIE
jgi:tetratricopeptide (TPR) repeat protein